MFTFGPAFLNSSASANDPFFSSTVLLCHMNGADGSIDVPDSTGKHLPVIYGSAGTKISTSQSKFGGASFFSGAAVDSAVQIGAPFTDFNFGAGQFTIECWALWTSHSGSVIEVLLAQLGGTSNLGWAFRLTGSSLAFIYSTTGTDVLSVSGTWTPTTGVWYHMAVDRSASNVLRVYVNGVVVASATVTSTFFASSQSARIGNDNNNTRNLPGYIDDARITKGVARYAGAFTPPTAAFPNS